MIVEGHRRSRTTRIAPEGHIDLVGRVCRLIEESDERPTLASLGNRVGMSPYHLQRTFKRAMGITPRQYADAHRLGRFKAHLRDGQPVTHAVYEAGYGSTSRLYERSDAQLGMVPATYRRGGRGMHIHYALADCVLGRLLVAATERGICAVYLRDADADLQSTLQSEYPAAEIEEGELHEYVQALVAHLAGRRPHLDLPIDVQATAFQWRVWEELRAIPYGATASYAEVARRLGRPHAARAVARACATNPVAIIVPCHRVVRGDGGMGGYRWGAERKARLLQGEHDGRASMSGDDERNSDGA